MSFLNRSARAFKNLQGQAAEVEAKIRRLQKKWTRELEKLEMEAISATVADEEALSLIVAEIATIVELSKLANVTIEDMQLLKNLIEIPNTEIITEISLRLAKINFHLKNNLFKDFITQFRILGKLNVETMPLDSGIEPREGQIEEIIEKIRQKIPTDQSNLFEKQMVRLLNDKRLAKNLKDTYDKKWTDT